MSRRSRVLCGLVQDSKGCALEMASGSLAYNEIATAGGCTQDVWPERERDWEDMQAFYTGQPRPEQGYLSDKEVNLEQVHQRLTGLMEDELAHKQLPGQSLEISALDMGSMRSAQSSQDARRDFPPGALSVTSFLQEGPGVGRVPGRSLPLPLSSSTLPPSMRCKHRAPNGGLFRQSPVKTPMPISYQAVPGRAIPEAIDPSHGTSI
ncbi:hypothetical protein DNTS_011819 [Danionella cerebrum]|uniref:Uncharacterized protein n=1 Tax=Danionella cerebrum TaxID=2873325 RepID=A0A553R2A7_9TELE|nr:hypothetical protein DNTS_011819 [Danionella translucida]